MQPVDFPEANKTFTKPKGWTDEECSSLRVLDTGEGYQSCWQPDEEERKHIALGGAIVLTVYGRGHPPVSLGVREVRIAAAGAVGEG